MYNPRIYHIFISHAWKYGDDYGRLKNLLDHAPDFSYRDYSVSEEKSITDTRIPDSEIEDALVEQIRHASVVLVLLGMYASPLYHEWIAREVRIARIMGKPIIGVAPWGQQRLPQDILPYCRDVVRWNTSSIITAIQEYH